MFASSEDSKFSTDQIHMVDFPDVGSVLSSVHTLDQSANFISAILLTILCGESDANESLGCSLETCSADVVVSQFQWYPVVRQNHHIMIGTSTFTDLRGGIAESSLNLTFVKW